MIGVDIVFVPEFQKQLELGGATFMGKTFRLDEIDDQRPEHLAGLWAAREAVMKAAGLQPGNWTDIVISHDSEGRMQAKVMSQKFDISIAHHGDYAVAVAQSVHR